MTHPARDRRIAALGIALLLLAVGAALLQPTPAVRAKVAPAAAVPLKTYMGWVGYNPREASRYAQTYVSFGGTPSSAVFAACTISAAGIVELNGTVTCTVPNDPSNTSNTINNWDQIIASFATTLPEGWSTINRSALREGDLIMFSRPNRSDPCLGGIVAASQPIDTLAPEIITDFMELSYYAHGEVTNSGIQGVIVPLQDFQENWYCNGDRRSDGYTTRYIRINADYTPPTIAPQTITIDYSGGPMLASWTAASDFAPDGVTPQSGVASYRVERNSVNSQEAPEQLSTNSPDTQAALDLGMCSSNVLQLVATDNVGNEATTDLIVQVRQQGDFVPNEQVDEDDLAQLQSWIASPGSAPAHADLSGDELVNGDDELWLLLHLGETCNYL